MALAELSPRSLTDDHFRILQQTAGDETGRARARAFANFALASVHESHGEFDQEFSKLAGRPVLIQFTPHLMPFNRGILATCYVKGDAVAVHSALTARYADEPFLHVLPIGQVASTRSIAGSNFVHLGVTGDRIAGRTIVFAALDNLTKGSSGQAIQNANLMLGLEETAGLMLAPVFP